MKVAKIFINGHSQAVRLPKECRFRSREREVYVHKVDGLVILIPKRNPWGSLLHSLGNFTDDFMHERNQPAGKGPREEF